MTDIVYWAVAECLTQRLAKAQEEIPGAFVPSYTKRTLRDGRPWDKRDLPRFCQYVFFPTTGQDWRHVANTDGVYRVLRDGETARRVTDAEMNRIRDDNALRAWDEIEALPIPSKTRRRRVRRSKRVKRPGPALRASMRAQA